MDGSEPDLFDVEEDAKPVWAVMAVAMAAVDAGTLEDLWEL